MKKLVLVISVFALLSLGFCNEANAKQTKRDGKWEASFKVLSSLSTDINGEMGSSLDVDSDIGWGFSLGYNVNPHILVNYELTSITPRYDATLVDENDDPYNLKHKMDMYNSQFNVVYNLLTEQFTPFVQAGLGWSYVDSNIADGPPNGFCWWHPIWGYICESYQNTHDDTRFSYNVAAGVRYELDNSMFFRASYQQNWIDLSGSDSLSVGMIHLEVGSIF
jgi:opacity protein-like surface antigen